MIPSKLGVHVVQGPRNGYGAYLTRLRDAGKVAVVKCVDDFGAAWEAKNAIPGLQSLTVGRVNGTPDPATGEWVDLQGLSGFAEAGIPPLDMARWYLNLVRPKWAANPWVDVWETLNEWSSWWEWQADFYVFLMGMAGAEGFKLASWACSTGNPPETEWPAIGVSAMYAKKNGHYLSMHEYGGVGMPVDTLKGTEPWHALRYRALYEFLKKMDADAPLIISECGQSAGYQFIGTEQFISDFAWYDSELAKDTYVVCATAWTLGNWQAANFQDALPALADYIATASYPDPVEPPPPPPPDDGKRVGDARVPYNRLYYRVNQRATADQFMEVARLAYPTRSTVGFSNDDAGIGVGLSEKKIVEVGGEFTPGVIDPWYQTEYGVPPENVDHIPYPGTPIPPPVEPFKLASPVPSIPLVITDPFNAPRTYANLKHEGVDLRAVDASGNPVNVCACADGVVVADRDVLGSPYGIVVVLEHKWPDGHTYQTWYAHLERNYVALGQRVTRGQPLGLAGSTGNSTGIHLHLSLQDIGRGMSGYALPDIIDPTPYLPPAGTQPPPQPPPTTGKYSGWFGLGDAQGGPLLESEVQCAREAGLFEEQGNHNGCWLWYENQQEWSWEPMHWNGTRIPYQRQIRRLDFVSHLQAAEQYVNGSTGIWDMPIQEAGGFGAMGNPPGGGIVVGNEMNLFYLDATAFCNNLLRPVLNLIKQHYAARFPAMRIISPPMSPQPNTPTWWDAMRATGCLALCNGMGVHTYWKARNDPTWPMLSVAGGLNYQLAYPYLPHLNKGTGGKLWLTEVSNNHAIDSDEDKGRQYAEWLAKVPSDKVAAVFFFCVQGDSFDITRESWVRGIPPTNISAIPAAFRQRWAAL